MERVLKDMGVKYRKVPGALPAEGMALVQCEGVPNTSHYRGNNLRQLMGIIGERYGQNVTFHTCSAAGMDLDGLLHFLEARDKVRITSGVVHLGGSPACAH
jgi:probable metal-binding protein